MDCQHLRRASRPTLRSGLLQDPHQLQYSAAPATLLHTVCFLQRASHPAGRSPDDDAGGRRDARRVR